jgi:ubiquitin related modifier 1
MKISVELSGGLELLFDKKTNLEIELPDNEKTTTKDLIQHLKQNYLKEKPDLFMQGESVRPGILVLINDTDWELLDGLNYHIQDKDQVVFISTLHGG